MDKSNMIVGAAFGSTLVLIVFAFVIMPPDITSKELIVSNGHGISTVGEITPIYEKRYLSLVEIFEQSESGVVRVNVQREAQVIGASSVGSGFVFDTFGHIITNSHVVADAKKNCCYIFRRQIL